MPLKLNWIRGKYLGISLLFFGIMGLVQALIIIPFGQYGVNVGSLYILTLVPIVSTILLTYSAQILYESYAQAPKKRSYGDGDWKVKVRKLFQQDLVRPNVIVILSFLIGFFIFYGIFSGMKPITAFLIAENVSATGVLVLSTLLEKRIVPPERY
ncbi:MAG: hypothetical protein JW776_10930 [Candidatus Lokiarchaeota archaeon]|nr:hypothetical protein [Candidatus Lokiarchaeota archaeon]